MERRSLYHERASVISVCEEDSPCYVHNVYGSNLNRGFSLEYHFLVETVVCIIKRWFSLLRMFRFHRPRAKFETHTFLLTS